MRQLTRPVMEFPRAAAPLILFAFRFGLMLFLLLGSSLRVAAQASVRMYGVEYVDAAQFGKRFGLNAKSAGPQRLNLKSAWTEIRLRNSSVEAVLNDRTLFLSEPIVTRAGRLHLSKADAEGLFAPILVPHAGPKSGPLRTIMIDPGHGGRDPGHRNTRLKLVEKTYTLDVAKRLERLLAAQGLKVVLTRKDDRYVSLDARAAMANRLKPDLFISIHFNGVSSRSVVGAETYVMTPHGDRSTPQREGDRSMVRTRYPANRHDHWNAVLGYQLHRAVVQGTGAHDRGLKRFRYSVLRSVECPAVLVEAGFLSNDREGRKIASAAYRQTIAESIATGIKAHRELRTRAERRAKEG